MKPFIIKNQKQVARVISKAYKCSMEKAIEKLELEGIEKYKHLFPEFKQIEYIGFLNYKLIR
jgi:hypothetical protein